VIIEISNEVRANAIASIKRYFEENMSEPVGDLPAGLLLRFFVEDIGPAIYNRAVADVQTRLQQRVLDLEGELYVPEFQYWPNVDRKRKRPR
jgi:uncharacterized protein (DUF2164 family)